MRDELYIDGNLMHVEGNIVLNRQVGKAADMGAILQGYSYTVQLPKTPENLFNIGFSHIPNVDTVYPHSEHPATLIREGITLFDDGVALIKSVGETIEVQLTWGINKRLNALGNMKLKELPVSDYMKWNKDFRQSETDYLKWVCKLDNEPRYQFIHHMRPAVKVSWLFDAICGDHVMNSSYRAEIEKLWMMLPSTKGDEIIASRLKFNLTGQAMSNDMLGNFPHIKLNTIYTQYSYDLRFMLGDTNAEPHFVRLPLGGRYRIKGTVTPVNPGSGSSFLFGLASKDKVEPQVKPTFDLTDGFKPNQTSFDAHFYVSENQDVMFGITDIVNIGSFSINLVITYEPEKAQDYANTNYLLDYPIKENLPDITCVQFVKSVMALFGLYSQHVEGVLTFFSVDDILGNKEQAIDLTDQLISNSDKLEYSLGLTQNNALKWAEDDLVEKGYGDHTFSADTYEKAENVVFQQPYAATKDRCILYAKDAQGEYELLKTEKPRLLSLAGTETWLAIGLQPQFPSTQSTFSTFTFEPLQYSTLYGKYWQGYNGVFATQPRVCTRRAYLSSLFVQKLDFSVPAYAEGNYYMLVSVRNYQQSGLAELELALIDGVEVQPGARLTNTLLESAGVPIKFEASKMALYQRTGSETDGKLIRELDESLELTATAMFAVDNGSGPAKKLSASKVAEYIGKNHKHEIADVNQLKTELDKRLLKSIFDENFSVTDALVEVLKNWKVNGDATITGKLYALGGAAYSRDAIQLPLAAGGSEYLNDLLDVNVTNPLIKQYLRYNGTNWVNASISYNDLVDKPSIPNVPAWALQASKPSYGWGEIGSKPTSFPPSAHSHDYLSSGGKAVDSDKLDGIDSTGFFKATANHANNLDNYQDNSAYWYTPNVANRPNEYGIILNVNSNQPWRNQLGFGTNGEMYWRQKINDEAWRGWSRIWTERNFNPDSKQDRLYDGWVQAPGYDANTIGSNKVGFCYSNNAPNDGQLLCFGDGGYNLQISVSYSSYSHNRPDNFHFRTRNGDGHVWNPWYKMWNDGNSGRLDADWRCRNLWCGDSDTGLRWVGDGHIKGVANGIDVWGWYNNILYTHNHFIVGSGGDAELRTRHVSGKHYQNDNDSELYLNWRSKLGVHVGGKIYAYGGAAYSRDAITVNAASVQTLESPANYTLEQQQEALLMMSAEITKLRDRLTELEKGGSNV